ncbi:DUF1592 domain-containing protein [Tundrisphaera lichenicola]|uniref:DUF1592 domain-containing protein n=1 Tax=Tundrisphaera lichenicola TaxID=2029860 RepID=UPI003EB85433
MRMTLILATTGALLLAFLGLRSAAEGPSPVPPATPIDDGFRETVRPFLETYCLGCHGPEKPKGDLDLSRYSDAGSVARDLGQWQAVREQLEDEAMPPEGAKRHPEAQARRDVIAWIQAFRTQESRRNSGDPGPVPARRLSNAEYDHTIRDLTGFDLRPTREFPVDPANEAGFDNSAESLSMSPALLKKYLEAARTVSNHLVLKPEGLAFAPYPMLADTDRDKYCVNQIIDFYKRQRTDYADYFQAAWRFRHRAALGRPEATLADLAGESGISAPYLSTIWETLEGPGDEIGPIAALRALWRELPGPEGEPTDKVRAGAERMRDFVVGLRKQLVPKVENLDARGISNGTQPFVLWKNRQFVANRMRYAGGASEVQWFDFDLGDQANQALRTPEDPEGARRFEATFDRFCKTFPDAFFVSERARVYLDPKQDRDNTGRLLSAGFHSMTGYFRDDAPLYELMLDEPGKRELDRLWREFDFINGAPMRQYSSYLWYERAETNFLRGEEFEFVRAEDKNAASEEMIRRLSEVYLAKARRIGVEGVALQAIEDQFRIISASIRQVEQDRAAAEPRHVEALQDFAERAYRRPLSASEREGVTGFYRELRETDGLSHEDAVRDTVVGILMSPHFCYRVNLPAEGEGIQPLSDYDLASRLSYFLWSSMPDDELLGLARSGELHRPEVLAAQARRMLRDDRVRGLATEFGGNWLDFRRFEEHNGVDRGRFPSFDDELRRSMFEEPIRFFVDLVRNDRPVFEFLDGDHTFVNPALARHYGMPEPTEGWVRIDDATRYGRGGLLPMAVFLTRNSPGLRTSPVKRGYWVVRRLLGEEIPPPPPDVPDLPDDESKLGDLTLRETLARHRADKSCAGCHERFDAVGLAFEGYGPIGEGRDKDLGGRPVDTRATFPRGDEGEGISGLRRYLRSNRREEFVENLCRKLLAYSLGRTLLPSDDETIESMRLRLSSDGGRFGGLVESIVTSPQFRNQRLEALKAE